MLGGGVNYVVGEEGRAFPPLAETTFGDAAVTGWVVAPEVEVFWGGSGLEGGDEGGFGVDHGWWRDFGGMRGWWRWVPLRSTQPTIIKPSVF